MLPTGILNHTSIFKKIMFAIAISVYIPVYADGNTNLTGDETTFIVTGYYSPLQNQKEYITGTLEGDKRLNGNGTHSASGNQILTGVIAAPSTYDFGTKIYLYGYGVGVVEDRGGAIVEAGVRGHEYDRIDIWMGQGDAGRIRAINWGVREIKGKIVDIDEEVTLKLTEGIDQSYKNFRISPDSESEDIMELQNFLTTLGYYTGEISGKYEDVFHPLIDFQKSLGIIKSPEDWGAGYFGPKTIDAIDNAYGFGVGLRKENSEIDELSDNEKEKLNILLGKIQKKILKISDEKQRKKATEELIEDIERLIGKSSNTKLKLKLTYFKENL